MARRKRRKGAKFATISLPVRLVEEVEQIVETVRYWPTKTDFIREAVMEKLERFREEQKEHKVK